MNIDYKHFEEVLKYLPGGVALIEKERDVKTIYSNSEFHDIISNLPKEILKKEFQYIYDNYSDHIESETSFEYERNINLEDEELFLIIKVHPIDTNGDKKVFYITISKKEKTFDIENKPSIVKDEMTGLLDKASTQMMINSYLKKSGTNSNHALMVIDIDNLRKVNETMGHQFGDIIIKTIAANLQNAFRKNDIVGRFGGDEFLVLMKNTSQKMAECKAEDICSVIYENTGTWNLNISISCSIGISYYGKHGYDYDSLFSKADIAMFQSKISGKNMFTSFSNTEQKDIQNDNTDNIEIPRHMISTDNVVKMNLMMNERADRIVNDNVENKDSILIVDDEDINRAVLRGVLQDDYNIVESESGRYAVEYIRKNHENLCAVLIDAMMPVMDGMQVLSIVRKDLGINTVPIVFISTDGLENIDKLGYEIGVSDIIHKPFDPYLVKRRIHNIVELFRHRNHLQEMVETQTMKIKRQAKLLESNQEMLMSALGTLIECRSMGTGKHVSRVRLYTKIILRELAKRYPEYHLTETDINIIAAASTMHDIGKIAIPDRILLKKGSLSNDEYEVMKTHTTRGCEIIESVISREAKVYFECCRDITLYHHERWDGRGYPEGLEGDEIPISAQASAIADVYDALTVDRIYKQAISPDRAAEMIINGECGAFSPKIFECFNIVLPEYKRISKDYADKEEFDSCISV